MARYKLVSEADPNNQIALQSINEESATAEAFEVLQWMLVKVSDEDAENDITFDDTPKEN